jgi:predicted DNA-binding transcriptional regulator YafY/transposase
MEKTYLKRDRTARLLKVQMLLSQYPHGVRVEEIADRCSVSKRTTYRDLVALESELGVPLWEEGNKRGVVEGYFLTPISFTRAEAMNIFLAIRLLQNYSHLEKSSLISTFMKLNVAVPPVVQNQIQYVIENLQNQQEDKRKVLNYNRIIEAWLAQRLIKIRYQTISDKEPLERNIEPYFIEPATRRRACYLVAYCHLSQDIICINIDHIIGEVNILSDTYVIPVSFNAMDYLKLSWDVRRGGETQKIRLLLSPKLGSTLMHSIIHPSQQFELLDDGSVILTLKLSYGNDFCGWILSWGDDIKVIEPETLRKWIIAVSRSMLNTYKTESLPPRSVFSDPKRWMDSANVADIELTDNQWVLINNILPPKPWTGRPRINDRRIINGILWVLRTGLSWSDLPREYAAPSTCNTRFLSWQRNGTWERICQTLLATLDEPQKSKVGKAILGSQGFLKQE